jgi:membrane associated rhomboid family serine protease
MRRPPPLSRLTSYPVTAALGLVAAAVTVASLRGRATSALTMDARAFHGEPWRLIASILPHVDVLHLAFNLYWLWVFGTAVEGTLGIAAMLGCVVGFGVGSTAAEYALFGSGVGLSGVGYGLFAMCWVLARRDRRFVDVVDTRTAQLFAGWFVFCVVMTVANVWRVANAAHGAGAVLGLLAGVAIARRGVARWSAAALGAGVLALALLGATVLRPRVNLSRDVGSDSAALGYQALVAQHTPEAITWYQRALRLNPRQAAWWYNLGVAYGAAGDQVNAAANFGRAHELDPGNARFRDAAAQQESYLGSRALREDRNADALAHLRAATALGANDAATWHNLGLALLRAGRDDDAAAAFRHAEADGRPAGDEITSGGEVAPAGASDGGARARDGGAGAGAGDGGR